MPTATQQERGSVEWGASDPAGTPEDSPPQHHEHAAAGKWREEATCPRPHSRKGAAWNGDQALPGLLPGHGACSVSCGGRWVRDTPELHCSTE